MDDFDRASALEEKAREIALANARAGIHFDRSSATHCIDCDEAIPEARQQLGGVQRCVECQGIFERQR